MKATQTVYLTEDRTKAVPAGDKSARFLLVREGSEISEEELAKYPGAAELAGASGKRKEPDPEKTGKVQTREPAVTTRDPEPAATRGRGRRGSR